MCCHESKHHCCEDQSHHHHECCCSKTHSDPAFWTRDEKVAWLEQQRDELREVLDALEGRITAIRAES
jgi:hypothetical protein